MIGMEPHRDMTVGELIDLLSELPRHHAAIPVVNGMQGLLTAVRQGSNGQDGPCVYIGEVDLPASLQEAVIRS